MRGAVGTEDVRRVWLYLVAFCVAHENHRLCRRLICTSPSRLRLLMSIYSATSKVIVMTHHLLYAPCIIMLSLINKLASGCRT